VNVLATAVLLALGAVLQAAVPGMAWLGQVRLPVLLGLVVSYALTRPRPAAVAIAMTAGAVQDALGMIPLGYSSFCFCAVAVLVNRYREEVFAWEGVTHLVFGALAALAVALAQYALLHAAGLLALSAGVVARKAAGTLLLGALATPAAYALVEHVDHLLGHGEARR